MTQKARGQLCTGQNQLARGSQDVGTWTGRALARTAQLWDTQNRFQMKCQSLCATLPCQRDSGVTCQQIFTCHSPNNTVKWTQGHREGATAPQSFGAGFACL